METASRRRTTWAIAVSAVAHLAVLAAALLQHFTLPPPAQDVAGPPEAIIPILILPCSSLAAATGTPRRCGHPFRAGTLLREGLSWRGLRISWLTVGI